MFEYLLKLGLKEKKLIAKNLNNGMNNEFIFVKKDLQEIKIVEASRKFDIEKSYCYLAYKLLWIMKLYIEGR